MKAKQLGALLLLFGTSAFGQANQPLAIPAQPVERGANFCLWQGQIAVTNQDNSIDTRANSYLEAIDTSGVIQLSHFRIACAKQAISTSSASPTFYDRQIVNCNNGVASALGGATFGNCLFASVTNMFGQLSYATH